MHLADHLGPAFGRHIGRTLFGDRRIQRITACLTHLPSMGIGVEAVVADHVFADSLCLSFGLSPDLAVDVEPCMAPAEDLPHQGKPDELFPQQRREDLMGEDFLDNLVMETADTMESAIRSCAPFGNQYMDMGMEIDAVAKSLYQD